MNDQTIRMILDMHTNSQILKTLSLKLDNRNNLIEHTRNLLLEVGSGRGQVAYFFDTLTFLVLIVGSLV